MYIQRVPHPLAQFNGHPPTASDVPQTMSTNATMSSAVSQAHSLRIGLLVLGVVLATLLLCLIGFFFARRRVASLLPCTVKHTGRAVKQDSAPQMQREGRAQFIDGFIIVPSRKDDGSSRTPTSPSSEGPSTPVNFEDLGARSALHPKDECPCVPIPIIVHSPTQTHQTTFLPGPDSPDFAAPTTHHEHFFDAHLPTAARASGIRPHGLPLSTVPEEASATVSFSAPYFDVDEQTLYGMNPDEHRAPSPMGPFPVHQFYPDEGH